MYVHKFIADISDVRRPHCFRTDNGGDFPRLSYVDHCDSAGTRREYTAPDKPSKSKVVDRVQSGAR